MQKNLKFDSLEWNSSVMRMLPPEIAFRYHALPIATDGQQVTVAVAPSDNQQALNAIRQVIDAPVCFIQADPLEIDLMLSQLWPSASPPLRLLAWTTGQEPASFLEYTHNLARFLNMDLEQTSIPYHGNSLQDLTAEVQRSSPDLFLFSSCHPSRTLSRLVSSLSTVGRELSYLKVPLEPVWPIFRILLVLDEMNVETDRAILWASRLACNDQIQVTVLPILPPLPLFYGGFLKHNLEDILTGSDPLGQKLQEISRHFQDNHVLGVYKFRDGDPISQIREEIFASDPDLLIFPSRFRKGMKNWLAEGLGSMLFKSSSKPLLMTIDIR